MAQQTAVDWLFEQIPAEWSSSKSAFDAYQQAKQMEEEQKIEFAKQCLNKALDTDVRTAYNDVEKYYNETYGK
jgi:hypothetical protein